MVLGVYKYVNCYREPAGGAGEVLSDLASEKTSLILCATSCVRFPIFGMAHGYACCASWAALVVPRMLTGKPQEGLLLRLTGKSRRAGSLRSMHLSLCH